MKDEDYLALVHPFVQDKSDDHQFIDRALLLVRDRVTLPSQVVDLTATFFKEELDYSKASLTWKTQGKEEAKERLVGVQELLKDIGEAAFSTTGASSSWSICSRGFGSKETVPASPARSSASSTT